MADRLDAVIAGGGPVGLTLAMAAAQTGARVQVLESRARGAGFDDARNLALSRGSWLRLERLGIVDALTTATPIRTVHVSQRAQAGRTVLDARDLGTDALGYTVAYGDLVQALDARACSLGLVRYGSMAESLESTPDGPIVTAAGERIAASAAFIADGGGPLPQALGLESTTKSYGTNALVARVTPERAHRNVAYERFTPQGPLALLPSGDAFVVVWTLPPTLAALLATVDDADFLSRLQAAFGWRAGRFVTVDSRAEYPLQLRTASMAARGPVALVGNAAQTLHPVAGQGLNLGLRDAWAAATALAASRGDLFDGEAYARARRTDRERTIRFTDGLAELFTMDAPGLPLMRTAMLTMLDGFAPARRRFGRALSLGQL